MAEWLLCSLIAAGVLALALGALGAFVVWNRMAYFGDTIAHASLLGVAMSLVTHGQLPMMLGIAIVAVGVAYILSHQWRDARLSPDTVIGILAHSALAVSMLVVGVSADGEPIEMEGYLFGDLLQMTWAGVWPVVAISLAALVVIICCWKPLIMTTIEPSIAAAEGINVIRMRLLFTVTLALVIAVSITIVGALLITALLIIPAAAARYLAKTPKQMVLISCVVAAISAVGGLLMANALNAQHGPSMVVTATVLLLLSRLFQRRA